MQIVQLDFDLLLALTRTGACGTFQDFQLGSPARFQRRVDTAGPDIGSQCLPGAALPLQQVPLFLVAAAVLRRHPEELLQELPGPFQVTHMPTTHRTHVQCVGASAYLLGERRQVLHRGR